MAESFSPAPYITTISVHTQRVGVTSTLLTTKWVCWFPLSPPSVTMQLEIGVLVVVKHVVFCPKAEIHFCAVTFLATEG
jgi:hypothetical protein